MESKVYRDYRISGREEHVTKMEAVLNYISVLGSNGATRSIKLWIDGDGSARIRIEALDGQPLATLPDEREGLDSGKTLEVDFE